METEKFSKNSGCRVYVTTNNQIFGNKRLWTKSCHPLGIPKYNLGGVTSFTPLFAFPFCFSFPGWSHSTVMPKSTSQALILR